MREIEHGLWISDIRDVETRSTDRFDRVVGICQDDRSDNVGCDYYHFPLSDGPPHPEAHNPGKFSYELFEAAVDTIIEGLKAGETVLVHCHAGQSRSVMASIAALAVFNGTDYEETFWKVRTANDGANPSNGVREFAKGYVRERL